MPLRKVNCPLVTMLLMIPLVGSGCGAFCEALGLPDAVCENLAPTAPVATGDLQVTIEVRFIGVSEDFFERIGVDFDLSSDFESAGLPDIDTNAMPIGPFLANASALGGNNGTTYFGTGSIDRNTFFLPTVPAGMVGDEIRSFPGIGLNFDVPLANTPLGNEFDNTPGGAVLDTLFTDSDVASIDFAQLNETEVTLLLSSLMADADTTMLMQPQLMLRNGQPAVLVSDNETAPSSDIDPDFVPAFNNFGGAGMTVRSGPMLNVVPVVSADRRSIALSIQPVRALVFPLPTTVTSGGTTSTIEFPVIQFANVDTTVSVPDGGTILLGGIRRLSDGGQVNGVPVLNKVPYINRLFRNSATIRDSQTLMLMVTPRIIILEEEEQ